VKRLSLIFFSLLLLCGSAFGTIRYVAQSAGTFSGGSACNGQTAISIATFNSTTNSPGDLDYLCGTITTEVTPQGNGASGNPVTILWDAGAMISLAQCVSGSGAACVVLNNSWLVLNGGTPCGAGTACSTNEQSSGNTTGTGVIQVTSVGSSGTTCPLLGSNCLFQSDDAAIIGTCANCVIENLILRGMYYHNSSSDNRSFGVQGGIVINGTAGAFLSIHDLTCHDTRACVQYSPVANDNSLEASLGGGIYNTNFYNADGVNIENNGVALLGWSIYSNYFHDISNWDNTACGYHHDGIHSWALTGGTSAGEQFYNNWIGGNFGGCASSGIFFEGSHSSARLYNNVVAPTYTTQFSNGLFNVNGPSFAVYNNTIFCDAGVGADIGFVAGAPSGSPSVTFENNVVVNCNTLVLANNSTTFTAWDYNTWGQCSADGCNSSAPFAVNGGASSYTFSAWKTACSCDSHGQYNSTAAYYISSGTTPQSSSSAIIAAGANLTSLSIVPLDSDTSLGNTRTSNSRPATAAWDSGAYQTQQACGLPGVSSNQSCFNTSTSPVPLPNPIPQWGPNSTTAAGGNPYAMQNVGNLLGAGTSVAPSDFGLAIVRCTDNSFFGGQNWGLLDNGEPNIFAPDDSAFIAKAVGGTRYIIAFNPVTGFCVPVSGIAITSGDMIWSHTSPNLLYTLNGASSTVINSQPITISCSPMPLASGSTCSGSLGTATELYDFSTSNCIQNSYNGEPGWTLGSGSVGSFTSSGDDTTFAMYFSDHNVAGQKGRWTVVWKTGYGLSGQCNIWDTQSGKVYNHNGTQTTIAITPPSMAADKFQIHEAFSTLNDTYSLVDPPQQSAMLTGTFYAQNYVWNFETPNVVHAGYPSPAPINGNSINGSLASGTFVSAETVTQATSGASGTIITPSGGTPGFTNNGTVLQLGTITGTADATHNWVGGTSGAVFTPSAAPALNPTTNYFFAGHFAEGYTLQAALKNIPTSLFSAPSTPLTDLTPNGAPCSDAHASWNYDNSTDSYPILVGAQDYFTFANLAQLQTVGSNTVCPPPPAGSGFTGMPLYYDEVYYSMIPSSGSGSVLRAFHTFNSGWEWVFDQQQGGVPVESQSGKWAAFLTDSFGQFGSTSGTSSCLVGGPDWSKNDSTDISVGSGFGSFIMPQSGNTGHYVFQATSCSGSCATGSTEPTWPSSGTVVDNTITWTNVGVENCRAEIMLGKAFQGNTVTTQTPAPRPNLFMGEISKQEEVQGNW